MRCNSASSYRAVARTGTFRQPLRPPPTSSPRPAPTTQCASTFHQPHPAEDHISPDVARRQILQLGAFSLVSLSQLTQPAVSHAKQSPGEWSSPGLSAPLNPDIPKFYKTDTGVKVQELAEGSGEAVAQPGDTVLFDYVLRRANGYFIYSTIEGVSFQPRDVPVGPVSFRLGGDSKLIPGLQEVLTGMRKNGKRRALIPASEGYRRGGDGLDIYCADAEPQPPTFATKRQLQSHCTEPLLLEVELLRITPSPNRLV